ncbi:Alpha/Beta hydrolase protein [Gongronella butleri]|nr:Alpha/Beta hydrolase protein [Gongronella butleri]
MSLTKTIQNSLLVVSLTTVFAVAYYVCPSRRRFVARRSPQAQFEKLLLEEEESDYIQRNAEYVTVNDHELRVIYQPHAQKQVPLLVFVHGLGGQASQWEAQLEYFGQSYHVLAVDLLGAGCSQVLSSWKEYQTKALVDDVAQVIELYRRSSTTPVVLVGHSYGCTIATFVSMLPAIKEHLRAMVLISPKATLRPEQAKHLRILPWIPDLVVDDARTKDRKGGLQSKSVERLLGNVNDDALRRRQLRWNVMSRTSVYKRMAVGCQFPQPHEYAQVPNIPIGFIGGEKDDTTKPEEMKEISDILQKHGKHDFVKSPLVITDVLHMALVAAPDQVNQYIHDLLVPVFE